MTILSRLERVGEYLVRADFGLGGQSIPLQTPEERRANLKRIRLEAALRASVDLDDAYSADLHMFYLLRALEAVCELETSPDTRQGSHLLNARFYLREAGKSVLGAVQERERQAA